MQIPSEPGEKDFVQINKLKIEIGNETLRRGTAIDDSAYRKPLTDNTVRYLEEVKRLESQLEKRDVIDVEAEDISETALPLPVSE